MYITKDKNGNTFKWSRKGKNRECWVKSKRCVVRPCFKPDDCGTTDQKTLQKNILGICRNLYEGNCPHDIDDKDIFIMTKDKL